MNITRAYCPVCQKETAFAVKTVGWYQTPKRLPLIFHLVMMVVSCCAWAPLWIVLELIASHGSKPHCTTCGSEPK